ncbi:Fur family transcriptional regulator [Microbacterium testaceum]|jgi:Fur family ferric uptake transcriptional regulator|uniref:Fur family transcriptional regulator n=1 Tax=Microbacterium TaxID=33882 RepID=UPI0007349468|nr:Fur family transcriptional regulator [Microbacterium testaceum]KTS70194.1 Fur family transcriptional regulator [Microbacterium testaceum]KTS83449.1 Fur family transcriptional regulator [Microbacterium testaceum]
MLDDRTDATADDLIRGAGLRVTATRVAVLEALRARPHATADAVYDGIRGSLPGTSKQSVYNALGDFADAGLARRIEPAGHAGTFELRVGDNHHHVVCTGCGRIDDVDCVVGEAPCLHVPEGSGFTIQTAEVTFWGVCPDCRATTEAEKPRGSR